MPSSRTARSTGRVYTHFNQGLSFSPVAQGSSTQGVDSVTWASGFAVWQGNDNTVNQNNRSWPLQKASGHDVYRMETRPGDKGHSTDDPLVKTRSMLIGSNHPDSFNTNYDTSFGFLVEPGYFFSPTFSTLVEWQGTQDAAPDNNNAWPPYFITLWPCGGGNVKFTVTRRTSNAVNVTSDPGPVLLCERVIARGDRHHVYMRNKWVPGSATGAHILSLNGEQIVNLTNLATGYNDAVGPWVAIGPYHSVAPAGVSFAVQIANFEHGTADLSARIASPLAW